MNCPRVIIAGVRSGCGKTAAVCAVLSLLKCRYNNVRALKCGPDYIDPMFHRAVTGVDCANLDPFFCDGELLRYILADNGGDITVIEGAMGYYDGTGESGTDNSAYTVAAMTESPVILVVDAKGSAASLLAVTEGFLNFVPDSRIKGVLFNRMTPMNYSRVKKLTQDRFADSVVPVGYIPELPDDLVIPSRHLGLITANEITDLKEKLERTADMCANSIDIDAITAIAEAAPDLSFTPPAIPSYPPIRLAIAFDDAFCFYYRETLRLFEKMGAEILYFSPLADEAVPEGADGLLIGGGYPELYADILERNTNSKNSIIKAVESGMPVIAECGGFQYLGKRLNEKKMCGVLTHDSFDTGRLVRFGYITATTGRDSVLGSVGTALKAHEFHYYDSSDSGSDLSAMKPDGRSWSCGVLTDTMYAGYPHLYLWSNIPAAASFYKKCLEYGDKK